MKIKVAYQMQDERKSQLTIEVSESSIAAMLKGAICDELSAKVRSKNEALIKGGYITKIEDLDI